MNDVNILKSKSQQKKYNDKIGRKKPVFKGEYIQSKYKQISNMLNKSFMGWICRFFFVFHIISIIIIQYITEHNKNLIKSNRAFMCISMQKKYSYIILY